jgi:hypothetical protein
LFRANGFSDFSNQINKTNKTNQINQMRSCLSVHESGLGFNQPLPGPKSLQIFADLRCFEQLRLDSGASIDNLGFDHSVDASEVRRKRRRDRMVRELFPPQPVTFLNLIPLSELRRLTCLRCQVAQLLFPSGQTAEW